MKNKTFLAIITFIVLSIMTFSAEAQLRANGRDVDLGLPDEADSFGIDGPLVDYAGEMRKFIQNIARYARRFDREFIVIVKDAPRLLQQIVDIDLILSAPSSLYLKSIDGIMQPAYSFGQEEFGVETDEKVREEMEKDLNVAKDAGLNILTLDYVSKPADVDKAFRNARRNNFIPYAAPDVGFKMNRVSNWPRRPSQENSHTIERLSQVKNYVMIRDSSRFGSRDEYALQMQSTNFDMLITSPVHHRFQPLSKQNILTLQRKKLGARRLVLGLMDIGFADLGSYYWQDNWREGNPPWILEPAPQSSDKHLVQYWNPAWQQVFFGNTQSYVYGLIDQGYDGVVIEGGHAHELFENPQ